MKSALHLKFRLMVLALACAMLSSARADVQLTAPEDLVLASLDVSGALVASAGRDLSTSGSNVVTGNGLLQ